MSYDHAPSSLILIVTILIFGCIPVPVPVYTQPSQEVTQADETLDRLVHKSASREDVVNQLGAPINYRESSMSYLVCRKGARIEYFDILTFDHYPYLFKRETEKPECFEFILQFEKSNNLNNYTIREWNGYHDSVDEEISLFKFASDGDTLARLLLDKLTYYSTGRSINTEIGIYCPNADLGHADAQKHIGDIFFSSSLVKSDLPRAYYWYGLAALNGNRGAAVRLQMLQSLLTPKQKAEAEGFMKQSSPGRCSIDLSSASPKGGE